MTQSTLTFAGVVAWTLFTAVGRLGEKNKWIASMLGLIFCSFTVEAQIMETKLLPSDGASNDLFGAAVSISGDYAIVGAFNDDDNGSQSGSAYIYRREGSNWVEETKITASDGVRDDGFGYPVSISGDYVIVGSILDDDNGNSSGSAYVFRRDGTDWVEEAKLTASDGAAEDRFGYASISGDLAIVGAYLDNDQAIQAGSAYIFRRNGVNWVEEAKITASDGDVTDFFGWSASISEDYAIVGAFNGDHSLGSAYIFRREGVTWVEEAKLIARGRSSLDRFGKSVSISGDYVIVGNQNDDDDGTDSGSAYVFRREGTGWVEDGKLTASDAAPGDNFGYSVSIDGDYAIIGAISDDDNGSGAGSAYIFKREGDQWIEESKLLASDGASFDFFGNPVSISEGYVIVGADADDDNGNSSGSAYVYTGFLEQQEDISVEIAIDSTTVPVPAEGGEVSFEATLTNLLTDTAYIPTSADLIQPDGDTVAIVPETTTHFAPQEILIKHRMLRITGDAPPGTYALTIRWVNMDGSTSFESATFEKLGAGKPHALDRDGREVPTTTALLENYPDPFNPSTTIRYALSEDSHVTLKVYNMLGQLVATLADELQSAGHRSEVWNGRNDSGAGVAGGVYIYRLMAGKFVATKRMLLLK